MTTLTTQRLILRPWRDSDLEPFAALNADPEVMRFFPQIQDRAASDASAERIRRRVDADGWGLWAVEVPDVAEFIGFVGLQPVPFDTQFTPAVEIGWRLDRAHWGRGYAPEGAHAALEFAFGQLQLDEVISMTIAPNEPSQRVMTKIGMTRWPDYDFDHPKQPDWEHRHTVVYRITADEWRRDNPVGAA